jgi:hypothetical protein
MAVAKTMPRYTTSSDRQVQWAAAASPTIPAGRAGAADHRQATDNSGEQRSADRAGQHPFPSVRPGRPITRIVSRTEEARGSNPLTSTPQTALVTGLAGRIRRAGAVPDPPAGQQTGSNHAPRGGSATSCKRSRGPSSDIGPSVTARRLSRGSRREHPRDTGTVCISLVA